MTSFGDQLSLIGGNPSSVGPCRGRSANGLLVWLTHIRLSRLIGTLLVILITVPLVAHYYISNMASAEEAEGGPGTRRGRTKLDHSTREELEGHVADLRFRVDELVRIKTSVNNELRELENKRQTLQAEISQYHVHIENLKASYETKKQELDRLKVTIDQARLRHREAVEAETPEILAPIRLTPPPSAQETLPMPEPALRTRCSLDGGCFDLTRCSVTSGFPVYVYNPDEFSSLGSPSSFLTKSFARALQLNPHSTFDDRRACLFLVLVGNQKLASDDPASVEKRLRSLPHWKGDGRNHVIADLRLLSNSTSSLLSEVNTGRAMIASSLFSPSLPFRFGFDVVLPPLLTPRSHGDAWDDLPRVLPARRRYFVSFQGSRAVSGVPEEGIESVINTLKSMNKSETPDSCFIDLNCVSHEKTTASNWRISEWRLCGDHEKRGEILSNSTFTVIFAPEAGLLNFGGSPMAASFNEDAKFHAPGVWTRISTTSFAARFAEALKFGAVPVIVGDKNAYVLPFSDVIDWKDVVVDLPKARITEMHFVLRTFSDSDILSRRLQARRLYETYFSSSESIFNSLVALYRTRLKIPPSPIQSEPSSSVFNTSFTPMKLELPAPEPEGDDALGPVEPPFPSIAFARNFSLDMDHSWNTQLDPFHMYPSLPWDPVLPSDAKFMGSARGFRPIGKGAGGSGKEFTESLGGNHPREQFTIVMLTYERETVLMNALQRLSGLPHLNKVVVVWNAPKPPMEDLRWPEISVPYVVVRTTKNSLNNRFLPFDAIETDAVLSIDDDAHLRHDEILFGFRVWREARHRLVGFPGRFHAYDVVNNVWHYNSNYSCELSMVLTGAAFLHKYYLYAYTYSMPSAIRQLVDDFINCEDIAMNFLVAHITRAPPIKVTSRWTFRCPGCPVALSSDDSHFQERHRCINRFAEIYGYMPLLNTQFRVDSVLFKTRLPHDKQKCFKFI